MYTLMQSNTTALQALARLVKVRQGSWFWLNIEKIILAWTFSIFSQNYALSPNLLTKFSELSKHNYKKC